MVLQIDKPSSDCDVQVELRRATAADIKSARATDAKAAAKLLALVKKDSAPPYRRSEIGFAAILKGRK